MKLSLLPVLATRVVDSIRSSGVGVGDVAVVFFVGAGVGVASGVGVGAGVGVATGEGDGSGEGDGFGEGDGLGAELTLGPYTMLRFACDQESFVKAT